MEWFRWYHDTAQDPKFGTIGHRCGQPKGVIVAVWAVLLEHASKQENRGSLKNLDLEEVAISLELTVDVVDSILSEVLKKGLIVNGKIKNWDKRQPAGDNVAKKKAEYRARVKESQNVPGLSQKCLPQIQIQTQRSDTDTEGDHYPLPPAGGVTKKTAKFFEKSFWTHYPKKVAKADARRLWERKGLDTHAAEIEKALKSQLTQEQWQRDGGKFIPHPSTWLNQERWTDEIQPPVCNSRRIVPAEERQGGEIEI